MGEREEHTETETGAEGAAETVTMTASEVETLRQSAAAVEALTARVDSLETENTELRFSRFMEDAQRAGRLDAQDETRERWLEVFTTMGPDKAAALLPPAESIPVSLTGRSGEVPDGENAPEGVSPEAQAFDRKVQTFAAEHKISYGEAVERLTAQGVDY